VVDEYQARDHRSRVALDARSTGLAGTGAMMAGTDQLSTIFAALADPTRRDLVARLATGDATVGELAEPYDMTVQAISKHLGVLEDAGIVTKTKEAQRRNVHLEAEVFDLMTRWIERYRQAAEARYQRLDAVLADIDDNSIPQEGQAS
jgi:DNA-binding transcriptional ArsR family regulator